MLERESVITRVATFEGHRATSGVLWIALVLFGSGGVSAQQGFWDEERPLGPEINGRSAFTFNPSVSVDGLKIVFGALSRPGGAGREDLWIATRGSVSGEFGDVQNLSNLNTAGDEFAPSLSTDGLNLYFSRADSPSRSDILVATWQADDRTFGPPRPVPGQVNTPAQEVYPVISSDERTIYFSRRGNDADLFMATRTERDQPFEHVTELLTLNTIDSSELASSVSSDGRTLFLWRTSQNSDRMWMATLRDDGFDAPVSLPPPVNEGVIGTPYIAADWPAPGSKLYFTRSFGPGGVEGCEIREATWHPDCNDNGEDDLKDIDSGDFDDVNANKIPDECEPESSVGFRRGDSNADGQVNIADGVSTLSFLFAGNQALNCLDAADADDSGHVDIADSIGIFNWLFLGGARPASPGTTECGDDPTDDTLDCNAYSVCP